MVMSVQMTLPIDNYDDPYEPQDFKNRAIDFIKDAVNGYKEWVDYYKLPQEEDLKRRTEIDTVARTTCKWLEDMSPTDKAVDVVMNDGIQKMAQATAGRPFQIGVFVNDKSGYVSTADNPVLIRLRSAGRDGRRTELGHHFGKRFHIEGTCEVEVPDVSSEASDSMDVTVPMTIKNGTSGDLVSFTAIFAETQDGTETDRRGRTILIRLK